MSKSNTVLYVATNGNDAWSGRLPEPAGQDGPLATLERARSAVRALKKASRGRTGAITVILRGGTYRRNKLFLLTEEDSGTPGSPILYRGQRNETVVLSGGRKITGFEKVTNPAVLARLTPKARGAVRVCDLKAAGIRNYGTLKSRGFGRSTLPAGLELFFDDQPMMLARWPNAGFVRIAGVPKEGEIRDEWGGVTGRLKDGFLYAGDRPRRWEDKRDIWVHGYWAYDWADTHEKVEAFNLKRRHIRTRKPYGQYYFRPGARYYFQNILEELDEAGEWTLDRDRGLLYFWPPSSLSMGKAVISLLDEPLIRLDGASHVSLRGLTLEATRGNAVEIEGGSDCLLASCVIRNIGNWGVVIRKGLRHTVAGCDIMQTGDGGISASGGNRKKLIACGHRVHNNHIHHFARWSRCYHPAVTLDGVGITVEHNLIHDAPHAGILFYGNEHRIDFNEIHTLCQETADVGAIYTGRDYTYRGNRVCHNFIHDLSGEGMGSFGVYMDDCVSGTLIAGNVFLRAPQSILLGGGRDHRVRNNLFLRCAPSILFDARGLDPHPVWRNMVTQTMRKSAQAMDYKHPPYSARYPKLAGLEKYFRRGKGVPPEGNRLERNIQWGGSWLRFWEPAGVNVAAYLQSHDNLMTEFDPGFVDTRTGRFKAKPGTPAAEIGFKPVLLSRMGLIRDAFRPGYRKECRVDISA